VETIEKSLFSEKTTALETNMEVQICGTTLLELLFVKLLFVNVIVITWPDGMNDMLYSVHNFLL